MSMVVALTLCDKCGTELDEGYEVKNVPGIFCEECALHVYFSSEVESATATVQALQERIRILEEQYG